MENILFEYPVREDNGSLDEEFQVLKKQLTKLKYAVMISSFCALAMYFLSAFFAKAELIFYFLTALFVCIAMITGKIFVRYPKHFLHIKATENELEITYYKGKKSTHTFAYGEIEEIRFTDKSYTAVCIKREGRKPILFELNKDTPEQGFFLFTIQKILPAVCKTNSKAIAKEFGNEDDYYNRIYEGNNKKWI